MSEKARERWLYLISPIALLAIWQVLLMLGFGDRRFIPAPTDIAVRFWELATDGQLWVDTGATLYRVFAGYIIGAVPAIAIGLIMAMFKPVRIFFDPLIAALFPIPKVALMPLLLLAFGFGDASKIALVATAVFFPVVVNTYAGAANIDKGCRQELWRELLHHVYPDRVLRRAANDLPASRLRLPSHSWCWWRRSSSPPRAGSAN
jgi:ABC-type nitrate/sulfonate/bicarbonate transport system permease component